MKKLILSFGAVVALTAASFAQSSSSSFTVAGGVRLGVPIGSFSDSHSFGIGGELQGEAKITDNVSIPISAGYTHFFGKDVDGYKVEGVGLIPILAGIRVYASPQFFVGGKVGYGILTGGGESTGAFNYEPQIGINSQKFQVALGYNGLTKDGATLGHLALITVVKFN